MPNTDNSDSTTGRVTRSLRKRLTSIDSDTSSRPGTPVLSNLLPIAETVTPSKRVTRRTSLSTPFATPSKLKGRLENVDSPARRTTRRRSVSILEEEHTVTTKSKGPSVVAVQEEETIEKTPEVKSRRVTRSSSKSPLETSLSVKKSTPKIEVISLDDSIESSPTASNKKQTKVLIKKEKTIDQMAFKASPTEVLSKTSPKKNHKDKVNDKDSTPSGEKIPQDNSEVKTRITFEQFSPARAQTPADSTKKTEDLDLNISQKDGKNKNRSSGVLFIPEKTPNSPHNKKNQSPLKIQAVEFPQERKTRPEKLRNVVFNETAEEDTMKSVFPKTPGLTKSKSYILDSSKDVEKETSTEVVEEESKKSDQENIGEEDHEALDSKTPYKLKLKAVESSTPIQSASPKRNKTNEVEEQTQESPKKKQDDSTPLFAKSWTQSVSGIVSDKAKIDSIESEEKLHKKLEEEEVLKKAQLSSSRNQQKKKTLDDSDDDDDDLLEEDDNDECNDDLDSSEEECDREKSVFIDDEAMEVPEGEESMDSEERAYLEENEVPVYGESIGSQDSEDGNFEEEEEVNGEDDAFIVSDSEDVRVKIESDSDSEATNKNSKGTKYKRIVRQISESSNEDVEKQVEGGNSSKNQEKEKGVSVTDGVTENTEDTETEEEKEDTDSKSESMSQSKKEPKLSKKNLSNRIVDDDDSDEEVEGEDELTLSKLSKLLKKSALDKAKVDSPNRRMSSQKNQQEDEIKSLEFSKSCTPNKGNLIADENEIINTNQTENKKVSKEQRKSLNSSKHDQTVLEEDSDVENEQEPKTQSKSSRESRKCINICKPGKAESFGDLKTHPDEASALKSPKKTSACEEAANAATPSKRNTINQTEQEVSMVNTPLHKKESRKSLNTSKSAKSINNSKVDLDEEEFVESATKDKNQSLKQVRNSVGNTNSDETEHSAGKENLNASYKRESGKSLKGDHNTSQSAKSMNESRADSEQEEFEFELPTKDKNQSLKQVRNSVGNTNSDETEHSAGKENLNASYKRESRKSLKGDHNTSQSAKSMNESRADSEQEEFEFELPTKDKNQSLKQARKSVGSINSDQAEHSPRKENLNVSRRSLTSDGTNEEQSFHSRSLNKSKLEKTVLSFEGGSESQDTLSASEARSRTSGGSPNSWRKSRKSSLNQSKMSMPSDDESEVQEPILKKYHRKSMSENMILRDDSTPDVSTSEEENYGDDEAKELCFSDAEEEHKSLSERSTVMEFLGEEDDTSQQRTAMHLNSPRRKSSVNKSKLDETFEMEVGNSISMRDNLHRSIMRKSLNQSQLNKQVESEGDQLGDESDNSSTEEDVKAERNVLAKQGLSVSLSKIELKKNKLKGGEQNIHNSFTIGVSVRAPSRPLSDKASSSESCQSDSEHVLSEQEDLEKIQHVHRVGPYKSRNSLSTSLKVGSVDLDDIKQQKRIKRTSLYMQEHTASQSFVDNIAEEKKKIESKRKRKSNSFCGNVSTSDDHHEEESGVNEEPPLTSANKINIQRILSRCDEILEVANQAKRNAKLNAKKSKVKKPKWMDKQEKESQAADEVKVPLVSKKELKRKEKMKRELAKAIKHSTAMLNTIDPKLGKKLKAVAQEIEPKETDEKTVSSKRLPKEFLRTLEEVPQLKKKKSNEIESSPPCDKENSKKSKNKDNHTVTRNVFIEKKKQKRDREILETATGTVIVEPSTPVKLRWQNGFRESPKTPVGFKIQDICSAGRNKNGKTLKRAKTLFSEEDMTKANAKSDKTRKRKHHIEEPSYSLPKTQWTTSGIFVEEDIYGARPVANSTATQFMVSSLNVNKKIKNPPQVVPSTTLGGALSFKQKALFGNKVRRETARELIHRKQRKEINNKF